MRKPETRTFPRFTIYANLATQLFHNTAANGKPESCAMYKGIQFDETLKNLVLHFRLNTYACIGNVETQMSLIKLIIAYPYISFFREFKRIVYKVGNNLM